MRGIHRSAGVVILLLLLMLPLLLLAVIAAGWLLLLVQGSGFSKPAKAKFKPDKPNQNTTLRLAAARLLPLLCFEIPL
jgi:hypothetical protein